MSSATKVGLALAGGFAILMAAYYGVFSESPDDDLEIDAAEVDAGLTSSSMAGTAGDTHPADDQALDRNERASDSGDARSTSGSRSSSSSSWSQLQAGATASRSSAGSDRQYESETNQPRDRRHGGTTEPTLADYGFFPVGREQQQSSNQQPGANDAAAGDAHDDVRPAAFDPMIGQAGDVATAVPNRTTPIASPAKDGPRPNQPASLNNAEEVDRANSSDEAYVMYTIAEGDTLSEIAKAWFGRASQWSLIAKSNPDVNPHRLRVGEQIRLPRRATVNSPQRSQRSSVRSSTSGQQRTATASGQTYNVQSGDTLSSIAEKFYGDPAKWSAIYTNNRDVIGADPDALAVGMTLRIP